MKYDYNIIVLGAGSAGLVASYIAATVKAKVVLIESHKMGGDCLNTGCVPSKTLIRCASVAQLIKRASEFGVDVADAQVDFKQVMQRVHSAIAAIAPHDSVERYTALGVECIAGYGTIVSPHAVEVNGKTLTACALIVAAGAEPIVPNIPGLETSNYYTSDTIWSITEKPKKMVVLGGGPIGCELAQAMHRLGVEVTIVQRCECLLPKEDIEASTMLTETFVTEGIQVLTKHEAIGCENNTLLCRNLQTPAAEPIVVPFDALLCALGRKARTAGFGLEALGVQLNENGTVATNGFLQTNVPSIYVCGDIAGPYQFTHTAAHQAWYASVNALFAPFKKFKADYRVIPWSTFSSPEVARVGLNEQGAQAQNIPYEVTRYGLDELDRAIADGEAHGFVKVLTVPNKDTILGVTIVGVHAGDLIAEFVLAMKYNIGLNKILGTIHIYPTLAEANKYAAGVWRKNHAPRWVLASLAKFHNRRRK